MIVQADTAPPPPRSGIVLPRAAPGHARAPVDGRALADALEAGRSLGFVPRDPMAGVHAAPTRKPGPRRREEQDRLTVAGPRRVTDAFRSLCGRLDSTYWEVLDRLLRSAVGPGDGDRPSQPSREEAAGVDASASTGDATATLAIPREMMAWVEARVRSARYLDAGDYVRELIRRDQSDAATLRALEAALREATGPEEAFDMAAFLHRRLDL